MSLAHAHKLLICNGKGVVKCTSYQIKRTACHLPGLDPGVCNMAVRFQTPVQCLKHGSQVPNPSAVSATWQSGSKPQCLQHGSQVPNHMAVRFQTPVSATCKSGSKPQCLQHGSQVPNPSVRPQCLQNTS